MILMVIDVLQTLASIGFGVIIYLRLDVYSSHKAYESMMIERLQRIRYQTLNEPNNVPHTKEEIMELESMVDKICQETSKKHILLIETIILAIVFVFSTLWW